MYKLLCSNLSKSHRSLTNFTGYYRKVAQKCDKRVTGGKNHISETDLGNKATEDTTEPVDGLEETETLSEQSTRSFSSFFTKKTTLAQPENTQKVTAPTTNSRLFHSSNSSNKRGGTFTRKPFKDKEAEQYYQSAVEQCMKIKYKLDKYYQQANWSSRPSRITFDLRKDIASTAKLLTPKDKHVKKPEDHQNQIRLPELDKIEHMKSLKPTYQFKDPKIKITYPTHTVRYKMGTNGYKLQHKVKQQVVSDSKVKTILRDPVPQSLQTMKVKHQPTSERDRATLKQLKTKLQHRKLPLVAAGFLQKNYDENSEEAKQQLKYEKAVIKQHPTVREANVTVKMAFKNTYNKLLQKSGLLYQGPTKTKEEDTEKQEDIIAKDDGPEKHVVQATTTRPEAKVESNDKTLPKTSQAASEKEKTVMSEPEVNEHPISITKQVKMDCSLKHPKKILSEKSESFDVDAMCIKNKNSSNTTVSFGNYAVESEEKVKNFVESHKQEDKEMQAKHQEEAKALKTSAAKEAASDTFGEYLKKLKELRDQTAMEGVNKSETSHLVRKAESKKSKEVMEKMEKPLIRKDVQTSEPKFSIRATTNKNVEKKRYPISDKFVLKKDMNQHKEDTVVRRTQTKEEKVRSQSAMSLVQSKSPLRSTPVKTIRSENLVKKIKLKPLTPTKRKTLEKLAKTKSPTETVQKMDQTQTVSPLKKIMEQYKVPPQLDTNISMAELKRINRRKRRERENKLREEVKMYHRKFEEERKVTMKQKEEQEKKHKYRLDIAEIAQSAKKDENNNQAMQAKEKVVVESLKEATSKVKTEESLVKAAVEEHNQIPKENINKTANKLEEQSKEEQKHKYRLDVMKIEASIKNMLAKDTNKSQLMQGKQKVVMEDPKDGSKVKVEENVAKAVVQEQKAAKTVEDKLEKDKATRIDTETKKNHVPKYLLSHQALPKDTSLQKSEEKSGKTTKEVKVKLKESASIAPLENLKKLADVSKEQILEELEKASKKLLEKERHQMRYKYALESFRESIDRVLEKPVTDTSLEKVPEKAIFQKRDGTARKLIVASVLTEEENVENDVKVEEKTRQREENQLKRYSLEKYSGSANFLKINPKTSAICALEENLKKENLEKTSEKILEKNVPKQSIEKPQKPKEVSAKARSVSREIQKTNLRKTKSEILQEKVNDIIASQGIKEEQEKATDNKLQLTEKLATSTKSESPKKLKKSKIIGYKMTRMSKENNTVDNKTLNDDTKNIPPKTVDKPSLGKELTTIHTANDTTQEENLAKLKEASTRIVKLVKKLDIIKNIQMTREKVEKSANPENQPTIRREKPPHPKDKSKKERPKSKKDIVLPPRSHTEPKMGTGNTSIKEPNINIEKEKVNKAQSTIKATGEQSSNILKSTKLIERQENINLEQKMQEESETKQNKEETELRVSVKEEAMKKQKPNNAVFCIDLSSSHEKIKKNKQQKKDSPKLIIKLRYMGSTKAKTLKTQNLQTPKSKEKKLNISRSKEDTKSTCSKTQHLEVNTDKIERQTKEKDIPNIVIFKETPEDSEMAKLDKRSSSLCFSKRRRARIEDKALKLTDITPKDSITITQSANMMTMGSKDDAISYFGRRRRRRIEDDTQRSRSESINAVAGATLKTSEQSVKNTSTIFKTLDKPVKMEQKIMKDVPDQQTTTKVIRRSKRVKNVWDTEHRDTNTEERPSNTSCLLTKKQEKSPIPIKKLTKEGEVKDSKMAAKEDHKPSSDILKLLEVMKKADKELEDMLKTYQIYSIPQTEKTTKKDRDQGTEQSKNGGGNKIGVDATYQKTIDSKTFVITKKEESEEKKTDTKSLVAKESDKKTPSNESHIKEKPVAIERSAKSLVGERKKRSKTKTDEATSLVEKKLKKEIKAKPKEVEEGKGKKDTDKCLLISDSKTVTKLDSKQQRSKELPKDSTQNKFRDKNGSNISKHQSNNKLTLKLSDGTGKDKSENKIIVTGFDEAPGDMETGKNTRKPQPVEKKEDKAVEIPGKRKTNPPDVKVHVSMSTDLTQDIATSNSKSNKLLEKNLSDMKLSKSAKKLHTSKKKIRSDPGLKEMIPSKSNEGTDLNQSTGKSKQTKKAKFEIGRSSLIDMFIKPKKHHSQIEDTIVKTIFVSPKVSRKGKRPTKNVTKKKAKPPIKKRDIEVKRKKNLVTDPLPKEKKQIGCTNKLEDTTTPIFIEELTEHPVVQKKMKKVTLKTVDSKMVTKKPTQDNLYDTKAADKARQAKSEEQVIQTARKSILESLNHLKAHTSLLLNTMKPESDKLKNISKVIEHKTKKKIEKQPILKLDESKEIYYGTNRSRSVGPTLKMLEKRVSKEAGKILVQEKSLQDLKKEDIRKFRQMPFDVKREGSTKVFQTNHSIKNDFTKKIEDKFKIQEKVYKKVKRILTKAKDETRPILEGKNKKLQMKKESTSVVLVKDDGKKSEASFKAEERNQKLRKSKERHRSVEDQQLDTDRKSRDFNRKEQEKAVIGKTTIIPARVIKSLENISFDFGKTNDNLGTRMSLIETKNSENRRMKNDSLRRLAKSVESKGGKEKKNPIEKFAVVNISNKKVVAPIKNFSGPKKFPLNVKNYKNEARSHFELGTFFPMEKPKEKFKSATEPTLIKSNLKTNKQKEDKNKYKYTSQKIREALMKTNIKNDNKKVKSKKHTEEMIKKQHTEENKRYAELEPKKQTTKTIEVPSCSKTSKIEVIKEIPSKIIIPTNEIIKEMKKMVEAPKLENNEKNCNNLQSFLEQMMATEELQEVFSQYLPKKENVKEKRTGNTSEIIVILPPENKNLLKFQQNKEDEQDVNHSTLPTPKIVEISDSNSKSDLHKSEQSEDIEKACQEDSRDNSKETKALVPKEDKINTTKSIVKSSNVSGKFSFNQMNFDELFAVKKTTVKAKIEEIFHKQSKEDDKIYKFNKKLALHFLQHRERTPKTRQIMAPSKALLDPRALEINEMQKILYKFLATELKKPYNERPTGFSLLKKYNKFEGVVHYSKDKEDSLPNEDKNKQIEEPKKSLTIYIEKTPPNRYVKKEVEPVKKPLPKGCEKLCLPLKNISQAALKPPVEELTTLNKPQVDKVQVVTPPVPSVLDKYKDLKITHLNIKKQMRKPDESFLPMVFAAKSKILEKKKDHEATKRQILEFRYELLRKIHKEFTELYEKDVNKNVGKFETVTKYYKSVTEKLKEKDGEEFVVNPQGKSIEEMLGPSSKPSFERVSRYYNLVIQKKERKNEESEEVSIAVKAEEVSKENMEKIHEDSQGLVQESIELDGSKNKLIETEKIIGKAKEKDKDDSGESNSEK